MVPPVSSANNVPVSPGPDKKQMIIAGIIVVVVVLAIIALYTLPAPAGGSAVQSSATPAAAAVSKSAAGTAQQSLPAAAQVTAQKAVDFAIDAGAQEKCGLTCRQLSPTVTNTGTATAHNVCFTIDMHNSKGELIALNSAPSIQKCVGNLASGESRSEPIKIEADCGFLASKCVSQTLILKTRATCDETTVQFPDTVIAV
ncbi:MAG: hypothetical protein WC593_14010 [Methanoregula sp.]